MNKYILAGNRIRSGDVAVKGSPNYKNFDEYLVSKDEWENQKTTSSKFAVSLSLDEYLHERMESLHSRMYDDATKRVQATLVNYQHKQFLSSYWGDGSTSSNDGMGVQVEVSSLQAEQNPHYGSEKGTTINLYIQIKPN